MCVGCASQLVQGFQSRSLPSGPHLAVGWTWEEDKKRKHQTSDQRRLPAEFKHITKRRRRN